MSQFRIVFWAENSNFWNRINYKYLAPKFNVWFFLDRNFWAFLVSLNLVFTYPITLLDLHLDVIAKCPFQHYCLTLAQLTKGSDFLLLLVKNCTPISLTNSFFNFFFTFWHTLNFSAKIYVIFCVSKILNFHPQKIISK